MKKISISLILALGLIGFGGSSVSAEPGWQKIRSDLINFYDYIFFYNFKLGRPVVLQQGGMVKVEVAPYTTITERGKGSPVMQVEVYEDDGGTGDDIIDIFAYYPHKQGTFSKTYNLEKYRDGRNKKAEIQLRYTTNYVGTTLVHIYE